MKRIIALTFLLSLFLFKATNLCAQTPEATFLGGNGLKKAEIVRLQIKDDLKLAGAKFDSVSVIQKDYQDKLKQVNTNKKLADALKQKRLKDLAEARTKRLATAGLDDAEVKKVETYFQNKYLP